jgi:hypothetical protein
MVARLTLPVPRRPVCAQTAAMCDISSLHTSRSRRMQFCDLANASANCLSICRARLCTPTSVEMAAFVSCTRLTALPPSRRAATIAPRLDSDDVFVRLRHRHRISKNRVFERILAKYRNVVAREGGVALGVGSGFRMRCGTGTITTTTTNIVDTTG